MTPLVKNMIIIASLLFSILIVVIILYNVVSPGSDDEALGADVKLDIIKNSVFIEDGYLGLDVEGDMDGEELSKVLLTISDGENEGEVTLDIEDFEDDEDFEMELIDLLDLGIDYSDEISVSIQPIIKSGKGEKTLEVSDKISVSPDVDEDSFDVADYISSATKCSDCGSSCDKITCHSILEGSLRCYYEGGSANTCTICSSMSCSKYATITDCNYDRCYLDCEWSTSSSTGSVILNLFRGLTGRVVSGSCVNAPTCGDGTCDSDETYLTCLKDCDAPECATNGATQECGTGVGECVNGTQTCVGNVWGTCGGTYVGPTDEECNGLDDDCDESLKTNENILSTGTEVCGDAVDNDCDGDVNEGCVVLLANGEDCSADGECSSGNCYVDEDGDGYALSSGTEICRASSQLGDDCDDDCEDCYPGSRKVTWQVDGLDQDCNGQIDNYDISLSSFPVNCVDAQGHVALKFTNDASGCLTACRYKHDSSASSELKGPYSGFGVCETSCIGGGTFLYIDNEDCPQIDSYYECWCNYRKYR